MLIRPAEPADLGYIFANFISSFREASTHSEDLSGKQIASLLSGLIANGWMVTVAEMEHAILGWVVHHPEKKQHVAWMFTRSFVRGQGLSKLMLQHIGADLKKPITTPFYVNRGMAKQKLPQTIRLRPFMVITKEDRQ